MNDGVGPIAAYTTHWTTNGRDAVAEIDGVAIIMADDGEMRMGVEWRESQSGSFPVCLFVVVIWCSMHSMTASLFVTWCLNKMLFSIINYYGEKGRGGDRESTLE